MERVIDPAIPDLENSGSLKITYETQKKGRNIVQLRFKFKPTDQMMMDFS